MLAYAIRLTGDRDAAEDVVQDALVRAWRNPHSLTESSGSTRSWLFTVLRNIVVDQARARRVRGGETLDIAADEPVESDRTEHVVNTVVLADALSRLSAMHREALELIYLEGLEVAQAADRLGVPVGTIKSRTYYALRALRDMQLDGSVSKERSAV
jgi:RNA polymerase sigma-70 factor, ECF subfamily